ncbi:MAG: PQQ-dependent sugar dehydrogenase [Acidimicrobiia bacterium]
MAACLPAPGTPEDLARFENRIIYSGLKNPTAVAFAPDGRVFVTEQSGLVKLFDGLTDATPTIFADLRTQVYNFWDRGLLGLAVDPQFPARPYVYVSYAYDAAIGGVAPRWGQPGVSADGCPNPPGAQIDGCVVSGRLSRLTATGDVATAETVLINDWCQQFPSHSMGAIKFGPDGALYLSAGEGASFGFADWGQRGNPCGDPAQEGGALRAQDLRTTGDPTGLSGAVLRLDPNTGLARAGNPLAASSDANARRIIAYGLRNPYRFAFRPGTQELWVGDVGWSTHEEVNRISDVDDAVVENFGWPCYEGAARSPGYDNADLAICESLYAQPAAATPPHASYHHYFALAEGCETGGAALTGLAFSRGAPYPSAYNGVLFGADYARNCIWMMLPDANGQPNPATLRLFAQASSPVALEIGPGGELYYVSYWDGTVRRFDYVQNRRPTAVIAADPTGGPSPLTVEFDGQASVDPDAAETLQYAWDLDGDGEFDDGSSATASWTYTTRGLHRPALRVTDRADASHTATTTISVDDSAPKVVLDAPSADLGWAAGDTVEFSAHATDAEDGALPPSALSWELVLAHCSTSGCHDHGLDSFPGTATGSFVAPDHEYPSHLRLTVTATDTSGLHASSTVVLQPRTIDINFVSSPSGIEVSVGGTSDPTPITHRFIAGGTAEISAPATVVRDAVTYDFVSWSDGGARTHAIQVDQDGTLTATYRVR